VLGEGKLPEKRGTRDERMNRRADVMDEPRERQLG